MQPQLTDQAVVAVALARAGAGCQPTIAHLLAGLAVEQEGRAGRRLRERATAAVILCDRAPAAPAPPLEAALTTAIERAAPRAAGTVDLLDAALTTGGPDIADLLTAAGYQRDLDGWLTGDPASDWFEDAETYGFDPAGDAALDPAAARVVAQVRAVAGGAVEVLIAALAAPDGPEGADPRSLAEVAGRLAGSTERWDAGLDAVVDAAGQLRTGPVASIEDLLRAALVAGGDGPKLVFEFSAP